MWGARGETDGVVWVWVGSEACEDQVVHDSYKHPTPCMQRDMCVGCKEGIRRGCVDGGGE